MHAWPELAGLQGTSQGERQRQKAQEVPEARVQSE
jgi:hypothetical protein